MEKTVTKWCKWGKWKKGNFPSISSKFTFSVALPLMSPTPSLIIFYWILPWNTKQCTKWPEYQLNIKRDLRKISFFFCFKLLLLKFWILKPTTNWSLKAEMFFKNTQNVLTLKVFSCIPGFGTRKCLCLYRLMYNNTTRNLSDTEVKVIVTFAGLNLHERTSLKSSYT